MGNIKISIFVAIPLLMRMAPDPLNTLFWLVQMFAVILITI